MTNKNNIFKTMNTKIVIVTVYTNYILPKFQEVQIKIIITLVRKMNKKKKKCLNHKIKIKNKKHKILYNNNKIKKKNRNNLNFKIKIQN